MSALLQQSGGVLDDQDFEAVAGLVAAGEYRDRIPGREVVDLGLLGLLDDFEAPPARRCTYERGSRSHVAAWGQGAGGEVAVVEARVGGRRGGGGAPRIR
ncbi:hypothetical protein GCM10009827_001760 [Dactylosporangium maewongense]|uniref:Uncharacterized protein n=1 Tax=Dactylosporangium maewongense TaxID=634393 RepID=A0ABN1ZHZ4_9ACTN